MTIYEVIKVGDIDFEKAHKWWQFWKRWYIANSSGGFIVYTDVGVFYVTWEIGFGCDGRSGGVFVDPIFPNWGDDSEKIPIIGHDIAFHGFDISFEMSNELLKALMEFNKTAQWRCDLVYKGVSTRIARKAFGCKTDKEKANRALCSLKWRAE